MVMRLHIFSIRTPIFLSVQAAIPVNPQVPVGRRRNAALSVNTCKAARSQRIIWGELVMAGFGEYSITDILNGTDGSLVSGKRQRRCRDPRPRQRPQRQVAGADAERTGAWVTILPGASGSGGLIGGSSQIHFGFDPALFGAPAGGSSSANLANAGATAGQGVITAAATTLTITTLEGRGRCGRRRPVATRSARSDKCQSRFRLHQVQFQPRWWRNEAEDGRARHIGRPPRSPRCRSTSPFPPITPAASST